MKENVLDDDGSRYEPDFEEWAVLVYESGPHLPESPLRDAVNLTLLREEAL